MAFCAFDEGVAGFDVTPVENMFISEYMLGAPGDYVKVYLYGLMLCYHNQARMSLTSMAKDLKVTEEDVERAFRYWERNGLVRRIGDNPVCYAYKNIKQLTLTRAQDPAEKLYNRAFMDEVRRIIGDELADSAQNKIIFDWLDVFEFPEDVVLMLLESEKKKCGNRRLSLLIADKTARDWAHRGVRSIEDAERIVFIDNAREKALKRLVRDLGQAGNPSEDQKRMYNKWIDEWGFTEEAIEEARKETRKGRPSMGFLESILLKQHQLGNHSVWELKRSFEHREEESAFGRDVYERIGGLGIAPTKEDKAIIDNWQKLGFSQEMILQAAQEVHEADKRANLDDVGRKLMTWKEEGFTTVDQVVSARVRYKAVKDELAKVYRKAGVEHKARMADCDLFIKWTGEWGFSMDLVLLAAEYARGSGAPMKLVDKILSDWQRAGIRDVQAARAEHEVHVRAGGARTAATAAQDAMLRYTPEERRATYSAAVVDLDEEVP